MNRDKKVGLALGVLLVGIVAAFFFRNETTVSPEPPRLANPGFLDDRIAERPVVPYLGNSDNVPARNVSGAKPSREDRAEREWSVTVDDPWDKAPADRAPRGNLPPPQPIPMKPLREEISAATEKTDHNRDWEAVPSQSATARRPAPASEMLTHEVRTGETLSGLAVKYLGSSARYPEILEANRDQVKSPKDLRAGMTIRIPARTADRPIAVRDRAALEPISRSNPKSERQRGDSGPPVDAPTARREAAPVRKITSSPLEDEIPMEPDEQAFGETRGAKLSSGIEMFGEGEDAESAVKSALPPAASDAAADAAAKTSSRLFQAARRNPFLPGNDPANPAAPAERATTETARGLFPETTAKPNPPPTKSDLSETFPPVETRSPSASPPAKSAPLGELAPGRYLVRRGDTLERIAQRLFGRSDAAERILEANRDLLSQASDLREGMSLKIPRQSVSP